MKKEYGPFGVKAKNLFIDRKKTEPTNWKNRNYSLNLLCGWK